MTDPIIPPGRVSALLQDDEFLTGLADVVRKSSSSILHALSRPTPGYVPADSDEGKAILKQSQPRGHGLYEHEDGPIWRTEQDRRTGRTMLVRDVGASVENEVTRRLFLSARSADGTDSAEEHETS